MSTEELLQMLQEKGMDDNAIKALLGDAMKTLDKDFADADKKKEEQVDEEAEKAEASKLFGVEL